MAMQPPTAAPPSFYDNLPAGGDAAAGGPPPGGKKGEEGDPDGEIMKGLTGVYRVLAKMAKVKPDLKAGIDKLKLGVKELVVQGLKKDPKDLDSGDDSGAPSGDAAPPAGGPPSGAPPSQTDESHAA